MKNLILYYSWSGKTEVVAKTLHEKIGGELRKIETKTAPKGFGGAAMGAFFHAHSRIQLMDFAFKGYDTIFLGFQVWAGSTAPAVNSFLRKADFTGKDIYLFVTKADPKIPQKVIDSVVKRVLKRGGKVKGSFSVTTVMNEPLSVEQAQKPVTDFLEGSHLL
jgi:Flavodoxins